MTMPERAYYNEMWKIYRLYADGSLTHDIAESLSKEAAKQFRIDVTNYINGIEANQRIGRLYRDVELVASAYAKDRTIENADRLYYTIYGLEVKNES